MVVLGILHFPTSISERYCSRPRLPFLRDCVRSRWPLKGVNKKAGVMSAIPSANHEQIEISDEHQAEEEIGRTRTKTRKPHRPRPLIVVDGAKSASMLARFTSKKRQVYLFV